jgi:protein dithiol oxidoreductase (disulfide-forming)
MFRRMLLSLALVAVTGAACAQSPAGGWTEGKNYFAIPNPQPTSAPDKVVVTEVFSFACPVCNRFEPFMDKLEKELPAGALVNFVPASFNPVEKFPLFQRAYFTARALGVDKRSHDAMFHAVWDPDGPLATYTAQGALKPPSRMPTIGDIANFYRKYGVKPTDFVATANSFAINTQMKRADQEVAAWGVTGTPTIIVDNKWRTDLETAGGPQQLVDVARYLVQRELAAKKSH